MKNIAKMMIPFFPYLEGLYLFLFFSFRRVLKVTIFHLELLPKNKRQPAPSNMRSTKKNLHL